jgi:hypothetical protein
VIAEADFTTSRRLIAAMPDLDLLFLIIVLLAFCAEARPLEAGACSQQKSHFIGHAFQRHTR